jgi:hypothetical protein
MNKPQIRILYGRKTSNRHNRSLYFWWVLKIPENQSTVENLIKHFNINHMLI